MKTYRVGEIVRMWREEAKLSRYEVAKRAGLSTQVVDGIEESQHTDRATLYTVRRVCAALGKSVADMCALLPPLEQK